MIIITGASGRYGRLVVEALLARTEPTSIVAAVRDPEAITDLERRGVEVRLADFNKPETLAPAFAGGSTLLLVPTPALGRRYAQMENAVTAAATAKVGRIAYAGFLNGDHSTLILGDEHKKTEALIRRSSIRYIFLRNGPYIEPFAGELGDLPKALSTGELVGSAGDGKYSGACREDLAEAAAIALLRSAPGDIVYELAGTAFTMADVAEAISTLSRTPVSYKSLPVEEYAAVLTEAGYSKSIADIAAEATFAAQRGDWYSDSTDLTDLLGRASTPLIDVVEATMKRAEASPKGSHGTSQ